MHHSLRQSVDIMCAATVLCQEYIATTLFRYITIYHPFIYHEYIYTIASYKYNIMYVYIHVLHFQGIYVIYYVNKLYTRCDTV